MGFCRPSLVLAISLKEEIAEKVKRFQLFLFFSLTNQSLGGTLTRDFRALCFFHQTTSPGPLIHGLKPFRIWFRIREDNQKNWLHIGDNDTAVLVTAVSMTQLCLSQRCQ
jgi:hypothetical protein